MTKRQVFFSFHYSMDSWKVAQVKNMGVINQSGMWSPNDWEEVRLKTDSSIKKWIDAQISGRSCVVVLIGKETNYDLVK